MNKFRLLVKYFEFKEIFLPKYTGDDKVLNAIKQFNNSITD